MTRPRTVLSPALIVNPLAEEPALAPFNSINGVPL
jgi:hypothetical protein